MITFGSEMVITNSNARLESEINNVCLGLFGETGKRTAWYQVQDQRWAKPNTSRKGPSSQ